MTGPLRLHKSISPAIPTRCLTSRPASLTSAIDHGIRRSRRVDGSPTGSNLLSRGDIKTRITGGTPQRRAETSRFAQKTEYGKHDRATSGRDRPSRARDRSPSFSRTSAQDSREQYSSRSRDGSRLSGRNRERADTSGRQRQFPSPSLRGTGSGFDTSTSSRIRDTSTPRSRSTTRDSFSPRSRARVGDSFKPQSKRSSDDIPIGTYRGDSSPAEYNKKLGKELKPFKERPQAYENRGHTGELRWSSKDRKKERSAIRENDRTDPEANPDFVKPAPKHSKAPLSIPYTTPASDFIYGTSAVTAALRSARRKLYKLYIYDGENRSSPERDASVLKLGLVAGVHVSKVGEEWMSLLDKMSHGRPHNVSKSCGSSFMTGFDKM